MVGQVNTKGIFPKEMIAVLRVARSEDTKQWFVFEIPDTRVELYQENGGLITSPEGWGIDVGHR